MLAAFRSDIPFLFLGASFITVGVLAAGFCALRRRMDALLSWSALFAILYGLRLWLDSLLTQMTLPPGFPLGRVLPVLDFLVPIPAFYFFHAAGFLGRRGKWVAAVLSSLFVALIGASLLFGPSRALHGINNVVVIGALLTLAIVSTRGPRTRDSLVVRAGILAFIAGALWDNTVGYFVMPSRIEPWGFAVLLASLGYVAGRRTLEREGQLRSLHRELDVAREIQLSLVPGAFPGSALFRLAARFVPMASVGGDFYDYLTGDGNRIGILIADVSGHGVPAALIASMVKAAATSQRHNLEHPARLLDGMNQVLCGTTQQQMVTAAYAYLDAASHELRYAAAGHPSLLLLRGQEIVEVAENGLPLAAFHGAEYSELSLPLQAGDRLLLYTDGLIEARDGEGKMFGEDAVRSLLRDTMRLSAEDAADRLLSAVQRWGRAQEDDLTVLVCDFMPGASIRF